MPTLPWTTLTQPPPGARAFVTASRPEVRPPRDVPRFLRGSLAARRQVRSAPGGLGAALVAEPLRRTFRTPSARADGDARYACARTEPRRSVMTSLRPVMRESILPFREAPAGDRADARRRLAGERRARQAASGPAGPGGTAPGGDGPAAA
ncbi:DUF3291 domain-containing protein [Streptomyces sp. NPDC014344]|uniref:DUF3291 domain-containing protein n=1 Tax=Streptomyces sp. NPDC014344 TaxID=3364871 RepID=UPI0036FE7E7E